MAEKYCDCLVCPCNVPFTSTPGISVRVCSECFIGNHMDWKTAERPR